MSRIFHWEQAGTSAAARTAQVCEIEGHKLGVRRNRSHKYTALLDGKDLKWAMNSADDAKSALETHFNLKFPDFNKLD